MELALSSSALVISLLAVAINYWSNRPWLSIDLLLEDNESNTYTTYKNKVTIILKNMRKSPLIVDWKKSHLFKGKHFLLAHEGWVQKNDNHPSEVPRQYKSLILYPNKKADFDLRMYNIVTRIKYPDTVNVTAANTRQDVEKVDIAIVYHSRNPLLRVFPLRTKAIINLKYASDEIENLINLP